MKIAEKIKQVRGEMIKNDIHAYIIDNADPHHSEHVAGYWKEREWLSGFTGSNGIVVLTPDAMAVYTDSRYTLQAQEELKGIEVTIVTSRNNIADACEWLNSQLPLVKQKIAIRTDVFSVADVTVIKQKLNKQFELVAADLIAPLWNDRPPLSDKKIFILEEIYSGKPAIGKIKDVQALMEQQQADVLILTALDDVAWLFNIRGYDSAYEPLVTAYAVVEKSKSIIFIPDDKLSDEVRAALNQQQVEIRKYDDIKHYISTIPEKTNVWLNTISMNQALFDCFPRHIYITDSISPVAYLKSKKNAIEIKGIKNACIKDGVALVRFQRWLEENIGTGKVDEKRIASTLKTFRAEQDLFFSESFETIAGYGKHGAIVHYHATDKTNALLEQKSFLLLDSGAQYLDGTTDITRTIALGTPTNEQKRDYTLVLKGHIALGTIHFPYGTCGFQLDVLARRYLWNNGMNYGHGTGHGIGHFLNVHEGPQSIRTDTNTTILEEGMLLSNEPGVYKAGEYGIRLENMMLVTADRETEFGDFLKFDTLTLFPFDKKSIDFSLLTNEEVCWLEDYHAMVYEKLKPYLNEEEQKWLKQKTT